MRADEWQLKLRENVQAGLAKLSGASDAAAARFLRSQRAISTAVDGMKSNIRAGIGGAWQGITEQLGEYKQQLIGSLPLPPQMASALGALAGPLGVAVALVGALSLGLAKGVQAAEQYGRGFRELRNLNLDKTQAELDQLNDSLLGLSFERGLNAEAVTKAYYDIQSATGQYGEDVLRMAGRIGEASRALNMDYSSAVNAVSKSMLAFKLEADQVDAIMASNAKTVQVGVTTFDELARSQTEYAGAASAVGQTLDSANKVFAALTQSTKNSAVAATMTKGAFQDLTKANTVNGLNQIGVAVFDANGQLRQADAILRDLVPQLSQMSDQEFSALKEEIGGSEGLRGLLDQAKGSGDNLLRTLDAFDASQIEVGKVIEMANNDLDVMRDKLANQINAKFIELGRLVQPIVVAMLKGFSWVLERVVGIGSALGKVWEWMRAIYDQSMVVRFTLESLFAVVEAGWSVVKGIIGATLEAMMTPVRVMGKVLQGEFGQAWDELTGGAAAFADELGGGVKGVATAFGDALDATLNPQRTVQVQPVMGELETPMQQALVGANAGAPSPGGFVPNAGGTGAANDAARQGVSQVVGGGQQVRNVTVNIQSLVREIVVNTTTVREGMTDIKRAVEQGIIQAVNGAELAVAND